MATDQDRENGRKGVEAVKTFMRNAKWEPEVVKDLPEYCAFRVSFKDDAPVVGCLLEVYIEQQQFVFYLLYRPVVPPERRQAVTEFMMRANYGMKIGNFEINLGDGEARYKSSVDFQRAELTDVLVHNAVMAALDSAQPYSSALLSVVESGTSPVDAIRAVEGS